MIDLTSSIIESLDGQNTLAVTEAQRTLTLVANQGVLNRTSSSFGINSPSGADDADGIDGDAGMEFIELFFRWPGGTTCISLNGDWHARHRRQWLLAQMSFAPTQAGYSRSMSAKSVAASSLAYTICSGNGFGLTAVHFQPVVERLNEPSHLGVIVFLLPDSHMEIVAQRKENARLWTTLADT